jgi:hypothetical protein
LFALSLASASVGCGSEESKASGPSDACVAMADACAAKQQACVDGSSGAACAPCPEGQYADTGLSCAPLEGEKWSHDFETFTTKPGEEILGLCQSWTLGNATELWFDSVELLQDEASHHSNWTFVPDDKFDGPDGVWKCADRNYSQLTSALSGGVLYAQSTQAAKEVQRFPNGAAVRIPPYSRIIGDVHILNTTNASISGHARLNIYTRPLESVKVKLVPFHVTYEGLDIPPHASSRFTGECEIDNTYQSMTGKPLSLVTYYGLPHMHAMGTRFFLEIIGGPHDGESLLDTPSTRGDALGRAYDPPVDLTGATGLRFGCEYTNERNEAVKWGFGDQEMCEALGFADSPLAFESSVKEAVPAGTEGDRQLFTGKCTTAAFKFSQDKPGGPPPP